MNCRICNCETDVNHEINRVDYPICDECTMTIFFNVAKAVKYNKTIFDISAKKERKPVEVHPEISRQVLSFLYNDLLKQDVSFDKIPKAYLEFISARVNDGHTLEELKAVAYIKWEEWKDDINKKYLRPDTLYRPMNFKKYLAEVQIKKPKWNVVSTAKQKEIIKQLNTYGIRGATDETDILAKELMATGYAKREFLNLYLKEKI